MMTPDSPCANEVTSGADLDLVRGVLAGSPTALDEFVRRAACVPRLIRALAARMNVRLADEEIADLSQEVLIRIWRRLDSYEGRGSLETWAHRFCFYQLLNAVRRRQRRGPHQPIDHGLEVAAEPPREASVEAYDLLARCLQDLGDPVAEVIRLKHYEQRTFEEIAERLGIPTGTAKTHYYRGLARMRTRLESVVREEDLS